MPDRTYSLWLTPAGATRDALASVIADLADQHDGPRFPPHITLLGSVTGDEAEIVRLAGKIAAQTSPLHVDFEGLGMEDVCFRALYLVASKAPALMAANALARQIFGSTRLEPFMPHLSLLYGDKTQEAKRVVGEAIQSRLPTSCEAVNLDVYTTEPPVESWRLAHRFALGGPGQQ
jgi:2'-5' RNA ligase